MKNNTTWTVIVIVVIIVTGFVYSSQNKTEEQSTMKVDEVTMKKTTATTSEVIMKKEATTTSDAMMKAGSYEAYSPEKISRAANGDVVLFFRASWCPTCRAVEADVNSHLSNIPAGLSILDVDYDKSQALKQEYGVTYQHTFVQVDKDGNLLKKWSGSSTLAALVAEVK